ncbi:MAG: ABC transporter ATP-binding protein [Acetobacteraceae bacterium]
MAVVNGISPAKLVLQAVGKKFGTEEASVLAVDRFDLTVENGEFLCIVGPSGCGKTTILNMIAGLDQPSDGRILKDGVPITRPGADRGVMFQDYALFPWLNVRDNIGFGLRFGPRGRSLSRRALEARVAECISLVGLGGHERKYPHQLSGGMRQRCALARLLAGEPDMLLMDEPLAALDAQTRLILQGELLRIWGEERAKTERRTAIFITHAIDEAVFLSDRVVVMGTRPGRVIAVIPVDLPRPRDEAVRADARFVRLSQQIWELIRDAASHAIA